MKSTKQKLLRFPVRKVLINLLLMQTVSCLLFRRQNKQMLSSTSSLTRSKWTLGNHIKGGKLCESCDHQTFELFVNISFLKKPLKCRFFYIGLLHLSHSGAASFSWEFTQYFHIETPFFFTELSVTVHRSFSKFTIKKQCFLTEKLPPTQKILRYMLNDLFYVYFVDVLSHQQHT